ncbi:hypothetical protein ACXWN7_10510, partial [Streptococcus pyogenes]
VFNATQRNIAETQEERVALLLKKLLDATSPLDSYELCDLFFISESTLRSDLSLAKQKTKVRNITILSKSNNISLQGS